MSINKNSYVNSAVAATKQEILGLQSLLDFYDENFVKAIDQSIEIR